MNPPGQAVVAEKASPCLARQPILTQDEKVLGYELLFRESPDDSRCTADMEDATSTAIDTLNVMGLDVVCDGRIAFINCTHQMLLKDYILLLPPDRVVVEIQENVPVNELVIGACQQLKKLNYTLALDNFVPNDPRTELVPFADFIKVDIKNVLPPESGALAASYASKKCRMLAQKVETRQQFVAAAKEGYTLFQGYFFQRPERMRARHIPAAQATYLRLLQAISVPEVDFTAIEELIKHDASLCYRLLRYLNSPLLGLAGPVQSIRHAMNLLGERELVRWIRMATTLVMGQEKCSDLVLSSMARARFCELISPKIEQGKCELFLMGMLSLMDAILEMPIGVVIDGLALDQGTKADILGAKSGGDTPLSPVYALMVAREAGNWEVVTAQAKKLNLSLPFINRAYNESITWARAMTVDVLQ